MELSNQIRRRGREGLMNKITTTQMEIALARHFNFRQNLIVPNVSWGLYINRTVLHECDLLILTKSNYLWEVEIKVSKSDLIVDKKKIHGHRNCNIKRFYFAIPEYLGNCIEHIPERAGIIIVREDVRLVQGMTVNACRQIRDPKIEKGYRLTGQEKLKVAMLGAMRIWSLKNKLVKLDSKLSDAG